MNIATWQNGMPKTWFVETPDGVNEFDNWVEAKESFKNAVTPAALYRSTGTLLDCK